MHLLYLDDSGSTKNASETHLVLGGLSVYEAQVHHLTTELDRLAQTIHPADPHSVEFHASEIFARRSQPWRGMTQDDARGVIKAVLTIVANAYDTARAFACAVHKQSFPNQDPMELAFEDLCSRFDMFLARLRAGGDRQRGILILDESAYETSLQALARDFRVQGTRWGSLGGIADVPLFVDSRASRVVQLADHIAYAVFRRYEHGDTQYFDIISHKFDEADGIVHGLVHKHPGNRTCRCLACVTRRAP